MKTHSTALLIGHSFLLDWLSKNFASDAKICKLESENPSY